MSLFRSLSSGSCLASKGAALCLLAVLWLLVGCGPGTPAAESQVSPLSPATARPSPLPTSPAASPVPSPTPAPTATPRPAPGQLVVLHTNDNWGETEPCG